MTGSCGACALSRQTPGAVGLNEHIVSEPREAASKESDGGPSFPSGGRLPDADRAVRAERGGDLRFTRPLQHLVLRRGA